MNEKFIWKFINEVLFPQRIALPPHTHLHYAMN